MYKILVLASALYIAPAAATVYVCQEGDQTVFRTEQCPPATQTKDVVTAVRERPAAAPKPQSVPRQPALMDVCTVNSDCPKGVSCKRREGQTKGICIR